MVFLPCKRSHNILFSINWLTVYRLNSRDVLHGQGINQEDVVVSHRSRETYLSSGNGDNLRLAAGDSKPAIEIPVTQVAGTMDATNHETYLVGPHVGLSPRSVIKHSEINLAGGNKTK
jgi:hypothetical protein